MATANDVTQLNGLFKTVYADKLENLIPDFAILQKKIEFVGAEKETGAFYAQPVALASEAGFTYNGEAGTVVALNAAVAGQTKEAQVKGSEMILRSQLGYIALARASKQGAKAFKRASAFKVEDMNSSIRKRLELAMLYGRVGVGIVSSCIGGVITVTDATWAAGIWAGAEGHILEAFDGITGSDSQHNGDLTISAIDTDAKTITVTGTSSSVTTGDYLFFKGARTTTAFNEMAGLQKIISNASTLFNISAASYSLWKGNSVTVGGDLTFAAVQDALARAMNKGLMSKCLLIVSPKGWSRLNTDLAALKMNDSSYSAKKGENGSESLMFHSANGAVEIVAHPFCKEGDAFLLPMESIVRIGSTDVTFGVPGMDQEFFTLVSGYNAVELQCMTDQAVFIEKPAHAVYLSGITYS